MLRDRWLKVGGGGGRKPPTKHVLRNRGNGGKIHLANGNSWLEALGMSHFRASCILSSKGKNSLILLPAPLAARVQKSNKQLVFNSY